MWGQTRYFLVYSVATSVPIMILITCCSANLASGHNWMLEVTKNGGRSSLERVLFFHIIFVRDCAHVATHLEPVPLVQGGRGAQSPQFHPLDPVIKIWKAALNICTFYKFYTAQFILTGNPDWPGIPGNPSSPCMEEVIRWLLINHPVSYVVDSAEFLWKFNKQQKLNSQLKVMHTRLDREWGYSTILIPSGSTLEMESGALTCLGSRSTSVSLQPIQPRKALQGRRKCTNIEPI